jgi:hypothetical protein
MCVLSIRHGACFDCGFSIRSLETEVVAKVFNK